MPGVTLDAGALIAIERADRRMQALLDEAHAAGLPIDVPAGALAQAWRAARSKHGLPELSTSPTSASRPSTSQEPRRPVFSAGSTARTTRSTPASSSMPASATRR